MERVAKSDQKHNDLKQANRLQRRADLLTKVRREYSSALVPIIGLSNRKWLPFLGATAIAYTDYQDGVDAKRAQKLVGSKESLTDGDKEDPVADKVFRRSLLQGIGLRAIRQAEFGSFATVVAKSAVDSYRDERMQKHRDEALRYTDLGVGAIQINRLKTAIDITGALLHISPVADNKKARNAALGMMAVGSVIGLIGEKHYGEMVNSRMNELANNCPDKIS